MNSIFKGYNSTIKALVTRGADDADSSHPNMIQVFIPLYHGNNMDPTKIGTGEDPGSYPWCQISGAIFKNNNSKLNNWLSGLISGQNQNNLNGLNIVYPEVGDIIWLTFEGGDIRCPIFTGSIATKKNQGSLNSLGNSFNNLSMVSGGSLTALIAPIIVYNEVGVTASYNKILGNDVGACSLGKIMWHGNNARDLLISIRNVNKTSFDGILSNYNCLNFIQKLNTKVSWSKYILYSGSDIFKALTEILDTPQSHNIQDNLLEKYIDTSLKNGRDKGLSDPATLMYYADVHNQSPAGANTIAKVCNNTLDSIHTETLKKPLGTKFPNRRNYTYNQIKLLQTQGKLTPLNNTSLVGNFSLVGEQVLFPVPGGNTSIGSKFGPRSFLLNGVPTKDFHKGIDIKGYNISGRPIIAAHSGSCLSKPNVGALGYNCVITSGTRKTIYGHMLRTQFNANSTVSVNAGDVIGYVGTTGRSTGPHLHFELQINNTAIDPIPYLATTS